jgi:hypothetical protein
LFYFKNINFYRRRSIPTCIKRCAIPPAFAILDKDRGSRTPSSLIFICSAHSKEKTVKRYALAAALGLMLAGAVQAAAIDLDDSRVVITRVAGLGPVQRNEVIAPPSMSELPEPEVFAMMLVGLILIGYRASRDSSEKFK